MLLELKKAEDHLQFHVRRLIRAAKKQDLHLECFGQGTLSTELHLNNLRNGPVHFRQEHTCVLLVRHEDRVAHHLLHLDLGKELDPTPILELLRQKLEKTPLAIGIEKLPACTLPQQSSPLDEKLITLPMKDWLDFFKSRYLIDVPKKMLYDALLKKGLMYQCHLGEETNFDFTRMSFYDHTVYQRGPNHTLHLHRSGQSLREMYLDPVRVLCSKIWKAGLGQDPQLEEPTSILLGEALIFSCYLALEKHLAKNPSQKGWSWVRLLPKEDSHPSPRFHMETSENFPMLNHWVMKNFNTRYQPPGEMEDSIDHILNGHFPGKRLLFIQDAHVEIDRDSVSLTTTTSSLLVDRLGETTQLVNTPIQFTVNSEKFSEALTSKKLSLHQGIKTSPAWLPHYILMEDVDVKKIRDR